MDPDVTSVAVMGHAVLVVTLESRPIDAVTVGAVAEARTALLDDVDASVVGGHLGHRIDDPRLVTHLFECRSKGYVGWQWAVTLTRAPRQMDITVVDTVLLPGPEAITAPDWVPYRERIQPGDMSPGDLLPVSDDDPRLVPTYSFGDDPLDSDAKAQIRTVANDLGLGRVRVLSPEGVDAAAERWYDGDQGPDAQIARSASDSCTSCGFLMRIAGTLSETFGVCANGDANDDGRVVSLDHGCGAHSETRLSKRQQPQAPAPPVIDTIGVDTF